MPGSKTKRAARARLSLRAFATKLGVSHPAVRKAIGSGRLQKSVARDARGPYISNVALALREWAAGAGKPANGGGSTNGSGDQAAGTLVAAQYRVAVARAVALEMSNLQRSGDLLDAETVKREQFEVARIVRERILNVPDRLAELDPAVRNRIRAELRQALGDIADELERE